MDTMPDHSKQVSFAITINPPSGFHTDEELTLDKWLQRSCSQWKVYREYGKAQTAESVHVHGRILMHHPWRKDKVLRSLKNHFSHWHDEWPKNGVAIQVKYLYDTWSYMEKQDDLLLDGITDESAWVYAKEEDKKEVKKRRTNEMYHLVYDALLEPYTNETEKADIEAMFCDDRLLLHTHIWHLYAEGKFSYPSHRAAQEFGDNFQSWLRVRAGWTHDVLPYRLPGRR